MKSRLLIIILLLSIKVLARDSADSKRYNISLCYSLENDILGVRNLNNYLTSKGYSETSTLQTENVFGLCLRDRTMPLFVKTFFYLGGYIENRSLEKSSIYLVGTRIDFLYDLFQDDKWTIAPFVGIQTTDYELNSVFLGNSYRQRDYILDNYVKMNETYQLKPGLSIERRLRIIFLDIFLGMQISYNVQIGSDSWTNSGGEVLKNFPSTNFSGLSLGLTGRVNIYPIRF